MKQIVDNLRGQEYINAENVEALRKYIRVKNPNGSGEELSAIFADALHKIIDTRTYQFEEKHRKRIKEDVLKKAVEKKNFSINAAEVFSSCLSLKLYGDSYIDGFTQWINQNQPIPISTEKVNKLVTSLEQLEWEYIENNIDDIVDEFEAGRAEEETAACQSTGELKMANTPGLNSGKLYVSIHKFAAFVLSNLKYVKPSMKLALSVALSLIIIAAFVFTELFNDNRIHAFQYQDQGKYANIFEEQIDRFIALEFKVLKKLDGLDEELKYKEVDVRKLKDWLDKKNSMLAEEPYFTAILYTSKQYDISPLLMFAIAGQEQAFVPKNGAAAKKIANNPFNVYGSWEKYNTDIYDSSRLAADVIIKSSNNRPVYINTIRWINRRYSEDPNWCNGVSKLFAQIEKDISTEK